MRFLHEYVAGLAPATPGYREIRFAPIITGHLDSASVSIDTPYGTAPSSWRRAGDAVHLDVHVPPGAVGIVHFAGQTQQVATGAHSFAELS